VTRLLAALHRAVRDLNELGQRWALVGGLAVSARAEPRTTRDIDLVVAVSEDSRAEKLVRDLRARGYTLAEHLEQEATGRLATVRLVAPGEEEGGVLVDLLFASSGVEPEIVAQAEILELVPGIALLREASPEDLEQARTTLQLIRERGFHRDKQDLVEQFDQILSDRF
jgi:hypothetical protein